MIDANDRGNGIDSDDCLRLKGDAENSEMEVFLQRSKADVEAGRTRSIEEFFDQLERSI